MLVFEPYGSRRQLRPESVKYITYRRRGQARYDASSAGIDRRLALRAATACINEKKRDGGSHTCPARLFRATDTHNPRSCAGRYAHWTTRHTAGGEKETAVSATSHLTLELTSCAEARGRIQATATTPVDGPARTDAAGCQHWMRAMRVGALTTGGYVSDVPFTFTAVLTSAPSSATAPADGGRRPERRGARRSRDGRPARRGGREAAE